MFVFGCVCLCMCVCVCVCVCAGWHHSSAKSHSHPAPSVYQPPAPGHVGGECRPPVDECSVVPDPPEHTNTPILRCIAPDPSTNRVDAIDDNVVQNMLTLRFIQQKLGLDRLIFRCTQIRWPMYTSVLMPISPTHTHRTHAPTHSTDLTSCRTCTHKNRSKQWHAHCSVTHTSTSLMIGIPDTYSHQPVK